MAAHVLIIGGAGFVGQAIAYQLALQHRYALIPTRQKSWSAALRVNPFVQMVPLERYSQDELVQLMEPIGPEGVVINLAGILHDRQAIPYGPAFKATHIDLTKMIIQSMRSVGLRRYLHMSALGASTTGPSMYSRSKGEAEDLVRNSGLDWTIFRPSVIFGEADQFINLFGKLQKIAPVLPLAGAGVRFQPVAVADVARAFVRSIDMPNTKHQTYDLGGPDIYTLSELVKLAGSKFGHQRMIIPLPNWAGYLQAWLLELLPGPTLMSRDNLASMKQDNILDQAKVNVLESVFGLSPISLKHFIGQKA